MNEIDVLAVFAHPDDLELAVAGTLLKLKKLNYRTGALDVTRGEMGTRGTVEIRAREAETAAEIMKLDVRENLELPDGHVWNTEEARTSLVRVLRRLRPKVIFTHQFDDPHPDHNHIVSIVYESARLASLKNYDRDFGLTELRPAPVVAYTVFSLRVVPSFIVDISEFAEAKMNAIKAHASQFYSSDSKDPETTLSAEGFLDQLESRMRFYGTMIGAKAGEPFFVREALNVEDPIALLTRQMNLYS